MPEWAYGRKIRPSTPIEQVLSYKWAAAGEKELRRFYTDMLVVQADQRPVRKIQLTKAAKGHASLAQRALHDPIEPKEPFKMKKFKAIPARLNTHRTNPLLHRSLYEEQVEGHGNAMEGADLDASFPPSDNGQNA
jgi:hypothetical protein